jgi:glucose/arabinose dehydrogenase/PKD repeat protein
MSASSSRYVGRVGALAVALGVGSAIGAGSAWADESADSSRQESVSADMSSPGPIRRSGSPGIRAQSRAFADSEAQSGAVPHGTNRARRGTGITADRSRLSNDRNELKEVIPPAASVAATVEAPAPPARSAVVGIPGSEQPRGLRSVPEVAVDAAITPVIAVAPSVVTPSTPARQAAVPAAAPGLTVSARFRDALAAIFGNGPASVPQSPLSWALLGWTRRQSAVTVTDAVAAAAQTTSEPLPAHAEHAPGLPADLERVVVASGLAEPTDFRFLPNGSILITEKGGSVRVFQNNELQQTPLITLNVLTEVERGLAGIAIDPDFVDNHYIYVTYTGSDNHQRLTRLTVNGYSGDQITDVLSADSEQVLYRVADEAANYHQGGGITFGPDSKLYWGLGDNFDFGNSQDLGSPHGTILRLDVHNLNPDGTATAPIDNPFVNTAGALPEIYAYGFRNPFRFTFTPTGQLLEADVGGAAWEEVNVVVPGANYGWPLAEGVCNGCGFANPIYAYPHTAPPLVAGAISSILVYTGDALGPEYTDKVFIADYALNWMKTLEFDSEYDSFIGEHMFDTEAGTTVQLLEGPDGRIYQLNIYPGTLSVIGPTGGNRAPSAVIDATPTNGYAPLAVSFSSEDSTDPDGTPLSFAWDFGDPNTLEDVSTEANPVWQYTSNGNYTVTLVVSDGEKTGQSTRSIVVGSTPPTATILTPVGDAPYNAGDTISFSAEGSDAEDGVLPDSAYSWKVVFHHGDHVHPFADNIPGRSGTVTIPTDESNVSNTWYRIVLTVTDSSGLSTSSYVDVKPRLVNLTFVSSDPDAVYTIDGIPYRGTYREQAVVGVKRVLDVQSPQSTETGPLVFGAWSDGGAQKHTITTPGADTTYTLVFDDGSPHYVPPTGALAGRLFDNQIATLSELFNAVSSSIRTLWTTAIDVPFGLLNALATVTGPAEIPRLFSELNNIVVSGIAGAIAPVIDALTDVAAATVARAVGVGAALAANAVPAVLSLLNAPVAIATAAVDGLTLFGTYLQAWDALGIQASLKYIPELIGVSVATQSDRLLGAFNDLRNDVLAALSIGFPTTPAPGGAPESDPSNQLDISLARAAFVADQVGRASALMGQAADGALRSNLTAAVDAVENVGGALASGESATSAAMVAWRSLERQAGAGRQTVHDAIVAADEALGDGA